jgi:hypothetical protein
MGWAQTDAANPKLRARARTSRNDIFLKGFIDLIS